MRVFFKTMAGGSGSVELGLDSTLFDILAAARAVYEERVAPLAEDQFVKVVVGGKSLCSSEEAVAADNAIRVGGLAPAFLDGEARAVAFMGVVATINCIHVVAGRRPAAGA
jgi:hypothetical protein